MAKDCPFCNIPTDRVVWESELVVAIRDEYAVTEGHTLVIPRRHVDTYFDATEEEKAELWRAVEAVKEQLDAAVAPDGYNVGFNAGAAAGQTVMHLHVHVIPRRRGDMADPRGGVRGVIPEKQKYGGMRESAPRLVVGGEEDPLLRELEPALDDADTVELAVAFIFDRGVELLESRFVDILRRGGQIRIVTGRYQDVTEPKALRHLRSLPQVAGREEAALGLRAYPHASGSNSFHPKAWVVQGRQKSAWVGSSNMSRTALKSGVEWNYRLVSATDVANVHIAFEDLWAKAETVDETWIRAYEQARRVPTRGGKPLPVAVGEDAPTHAPEPRPGVQAEALLRLAQTRAIGEKAGLVVLATGLGKTYLSAFDSRGFERVLFIAHREEILQQALRTFRAVRPNDTLGRFDGKEKEPDKALVFASIQTLNAGDNLEIFDPEEFDYIVVDEFHHAAADTYRRVLDYFAPTFLLGLTATPDRLDGVNLLALCGGNEVYRAGIPRGIESKQLAPFHYFGIGDDVKYEPLPWRSFTDETLTAMVATEARAQRCLDELRARTSDRVRALGFCVTQRHADFMRDYCAKQGIDCASVHTGPNADPRTASLKRLETGELEIVFCVDMFNEGVDVPSIDTVLMLRPTESSIVWLQQLGRGLRFVPGKTLTVLDFIGNHEAFARRPEVLLQTLGVELDSKSPAWDTTRFAAQLPQGVSLNFDLRAQDILGALREASKAQGTKPERWYRAYREAHGARPSAVVADEAGYFKQLRKKGGGWLAFVAREGDLDDAEQAAHESHQEFLDELESLSWTKSYKMLVLNALVGDPNFPGPVVKTELAGRISSRARRSPSLMRDLSTDGSDPSKVHRLLRKDAFPRLAKMCGGKVFDDDKTTFSSPGFVDTPSLAALARLMRELTELHLKRYFTAQNKSSMKLPPMRADNGAEVNARFDVEEQDGVPHVIFHSRGGKRGSEAERNSEYRRGLALLLRRLYARDFTIARIEVDSTKARSLPRAERTLDVPLDDLSISEVVAKQIGAAAKKVGQKPGAKGGNDTKRLRIVLTHPVPLGELWRALWNGDR